MQSATRRIALSDPHLSPHHDAESKFTTTSFLVAHFGHTSSDIRIQEYNERNNTLQVKAFATDLGAMRSIAWSGHENHRMLLACGATTGKISLLDLERAGTGMLNVGNSAAGRGAVAGTNTPSNTGATPNPTGLIASLPIRHNRACTTLAWSKVDPTILFAGYDKTRSEASLLVWDVARCLSTHTSAVAQASMAPMTNSESAITEESPSTLSSLILGTGLGIGTLSAATTSLRERRLSRSALSASPESRLGEGLLGVGSGALATSPTSKVKLGSNLASPVNLPSPSEPKSKFCPSESVNCLDSFYHSVSQIVVSSSARQIRILDTRLAWPDAVGWNVSSRAVYNLSVCRGNQHLFASSEEGLGGIVRVWDTRMTAGEVMNLEANRGGVAGLSWNPVKASQLGVGTKEGGVLVYDVLSGDISSQFYGLDASRTAGKENLDFVPERDWSILIKVKGTIPSNQALQTFAFVPTRDPSQTTVLSIFRDGAPTVETLEDALKTTFSRKGDLSIAKSTTMTSTSVDSYLDETPDNRAPGSLPIRKRESSSSSSIDPLTNSLQNLHVGHPRTVNSGTAWRHDLDDSAQYKIGGAPRTIRSPPTGFIPNIQTAEQALSQDIGPIMRKKAEAGFGLDIVANDRIEAMFPSTSGFLFEWLDRYVDLMNQPEMGATVDFDFTLQGVCGIWNGDPIRSKDIRSVYNKSGLLHPDFESDPHQTSGWQGIRTPTNIRSPGSARSADLANNSDYVRAMDQIMRERGSEFRETVLPIDSVKAPHRRLMLAICGELAGEALNVEIERIASTNLTKAACLAFFNGKTAQAVKMLQDSKDEKHKLMGALLLLKQVDPAAISGMHLENPYLRAMVKSLAGEGSWNQIVYDSELPMLERLVLAIRFLSDDSLSSFLEDQASACVTQGSLHGIVLVGLGTRGIQLLQSYLDRTGDLQTVAVIAAVMSQSDDRITRWIEDYRSLLNGWKLYRSRVAFDVIRGELARNYGRDIGAPRQVIVRCNFCQKNVTASQKHRPVGAQPSMHRSNACPTCGNRLPKCSICLMQIEMPQFDDGSHQNFDTVLTFCQTCHHGGHYGHIMEWFNGDAKGSHRHDICPVANCECRCAEL